MGRRPEKNFPLEVSVSEPRGAAHSAQAGALPISAGVGPA